MTTDSSLRTPAAEILPVPKMRKGARQSAFLPEREIALLDPYLQGIAMTTDSSLQTVLPSSGKTTKSGF
jgi:hypothetical protein